MRSLILESPGKCRVSNLPDLKPSPEKKLLTVSHCGICRTDAKIWQEGHRDLILPRVPGHEILATDTASGNRYLLWPGESCGHCPACRNRMENLCESMKILGFHIDGGFSDLVQTHPRQMIPVPQNMPPEIAVLAEPLACCINAIERIHDPETTDPNVLVFGAGVAGLLMTMAAAAAGLSPFIIEKDPQKLAKSEKFRQARVIPISKLDKTRQEPKAIIAAPDWTAIRDALRMLQPGGRLCLFSGIHKNTPREALSLINEIHYRQIVAIGAYGCTLAQMQKALTILDRNQDATQFLIENVITLNEVPDIFPQILTGNYLKFVAQINP